MVGHDMQHAADADDTDANFDIETESDTYDDLDTNTDDYMKLTLSPSVVLKHLTVKKSDSVPTP